MGVKYVKDFAFPSAGGFHSGSVQRYAKGGHVTKLPAKAKDSAKGMPARAKPNAPARGAPKMESKPKVGKGQGYEKGGYVPGKEKDVLPVKRPPGRGKDLAPARRFKGKYEGYAEGGPVAELDAGQPDYVAPKPRYQELLEALPMVRGEPSAEFDLRVPPLPPVKREFVMPPEFDEEGFRVGPDRGGSRMYDPTRDAILEQTLPPLPPIGALTPLPEEPFYSPQEQRGAVGKLLMPEDRSIYTRRRPQPEPVDRVGNRRAMMGDRRDMAMRPGMRGLARRAAPPRMRVPEPQPYMRNQMPVLNPFSPEEIAEYSKGRTFSPEGRYAKGGEVRSKKIGKVMREYKEGKLHSGSKKGPVVKNPKQAMAIALSEARAAKKAAGGAVDSDYGDTMKKYVPYESKGPKTRYTAAKGRRMSKERAMERRALDKARHAEKYAPGLSLDMEDESMVREGKMLKYAKGGKAKHSDVKMDKAMVKKAVHKHEKAMHPGKKMTKLNKGGVPSYGRKPMYGGGKC